MVAAIQDLEVWQVAEVLGMNDTPQSEDGSQLRSRRGRDLVAQRMRAHAAGLPEPEPPAASPDQVAFMEQFRRLAAG